MERRVEVKPISPQPTLPQPILPSLERILKLLEEIFPKPEDYETNIGETVTAPAYSITTVTWILKKGYRYYISRIYVDAAPNCTYEWSFPNIIYHDYKTSRTFEGNTHNFPRRLVAEEGSQIKLKITNTGAADQNLDIVVEMWARRV
ncbi:MAG: hypothetical protein QXH03_02735 [Candidatus Bathyarchaeia archaeon]